MNRSFIRGLIPPLLLDVARAARARPGRATVRPSSAKYPSRAHEFLPAFLDTTKPGFYVELGANDGLSQSNTLFLEYDHGWHGVLIEPSLNNYLECVRNRSPRNHFFCAACVPFDFEGEFVRMTYGHLVTVSRDLPHDLLDQEAHLAVRRMKAPAEMVDFGAVARTLNAILIDAGAPASIDFLSLDVEGAELAVLGGIDHARFRFATMMIESRTPEVLVPYLESRGYELVERLSGDVILRDAQPSRSSA